MVRLDVKISRNALLTAGLLEAQKAWIFVLGTNRDLGDLVLTVAGEVQMVEVTRGCYRSSPTKKVKGAPKGRDWLTLAIREALSKYRVFRSSGVILLIQYGFSRPSLYYQ